MRDDYELISDPAWAASRESLGTRTTLLDGLWRRNPITVQVLGLCSALAVTNKLESALVMGVTVTLVCILSNVSISLVGDLTPTRIRLITWVSLIATLVIVADQLMKAFLWDISVQLGPYLGLIITNCILLGRAESFASRNRPLISALDGAANGLGYAFVLVLVASVRELLGSGQIDLSHLFGKSAVLLRMTPAYLPNDFLLLASGAFIVLGLLVASFNLLSQRRTPRA